MTSSLSFGAETCVEIKIYGTFVLNRRVDLHAIDAAPARWRGDAGSSPLEELSGAPDTLVDFNTGRDSDPLQTIQPHNSLQNLLGCRPPRRPPAPAQDAVAPLVGQLLDEHQRVRPHGVLRRARHIIKTLDRVVPELVEVCRI